MSFDFTEYRAAVVGDDRLSRCARLCVLTVCDQIETGAPPMSQAEVGWRHGKSRMWAQVGLKIGALAGYLSSERASGPNIACFTLTYPTPEQRALRLPDLNRRPKAPRRSPDELPAARLMALEKAVESLRRLIERRLSAKGGQE